MPSRRGAISLSDTEQEEFLNQGWTLQVASIGHKGFPHLIAMWYVVIDGKIHFTTFAKSQKVLNLRRDPKMTGLIESGDTYNELRGLELVGSGRLVDDYDQTLAIGKAVGVRYNGEGVLSAEALPFLEAQARKRIGVVFDVQRTVSWDHSKLGNAY